MSNIIKQSNNNSINNNITPDPNTENSNSKSKTKKIIIKQKIPINKDNNNISKLEESSLLKNGSKLENESNSKLIMEDSQNSLAKKKKKIVIKKIIKKENKEKASENRDLEQSEKESQINLNLKNPSPKNTPNKKAKILRKQSSFKENSEIKLSNFSNSIAPSIQKDKKDYEQHDYYKNSMSKIDKNLLEKNLEKNFENFNLEDEIIEIESNNNSKMRNSSVNQSQNKSRSNLNLKGNSNINSNNITPSGGKILKNEKDVSKLSKSRSNLKINNGEIRDKSNCKG